MAGVAGSPRPLAVTGNDAADELLRRDGTALLIGMLLDQQVPMEWAFTGPWTISQRLGHCDAKRIARMDPDEFVAACRIKPAIHRFPDSMARRIHALCGVVASRYGGRGERIWDGVARADELVVRLRELPGFGEEKAQIFVALLGKRLGVRPRGWRTAAGPFGDGQPRSVADIHSPASLSKVRAFKKMQKAAGTDKQDRPVRTTR